MPHADPGRYPIFTGAQKYFLSRMTGALRTPETAVERIGEKVAEGGEIFC
jgi:hypothetical protein